MPAPDPSVWQGGWWRHARRCDSPNFGPRPDGTAIDLVVIHSISLPPGEYGTPHVEALFTNRLDWDAHPYFQSIRGAEVSSHFFIRRDGEVVQFVDADARAWHAGRSSWRGKEGCNDHSVGIELEGLEGLAFESGQYSALVHLCQDLRQRYPVADIAGHEHIAPGRKQDPGPGFDWGFLQQQLAWSDRCFPESVGALAQRAVPPGDF
ncbi:MAG: hypothetical protein RJB34_1219 [Pseudomonadota bacterium]